MDLSNKYLKAWLPFNTSPTEDAKLNQWTTYGNPTIGTENAFNGKALQLDGSSYIKLASVQLGGRDFYIDGWCFVDSSSPDYARLLNIVNPDTGYYLVSIRKSKTDATKLEFWANSYTDLSQDYGYTYTSTINSVGSLVHFKLIYRYSDKRLSFCINDKIAADWTSNVPQYSRRALDIYIGANPSGSQGLIGTVDELRIYDGTWFAYNYGTPPTLAEYQNITFSLDVKCKVINADKTWRYENEGTADKLTVSGTTLTDLPETKSITGTAFYQTARAKCFDVPATAEVWLKFDVYFDGSNRWRAFNGAGNDYAYTAGVTAQTDGYLSLVQNSAVIQNTAGICKTNQVQTVLLHMVSGSSDGVIEAWVDGAKIYSYTGDVNHGQDFADIYLQSDGAGTFFSNVIISNAEIGLEEGWHNLSFDVERKVKKTVALNVDVERDITKTLAINFDTERDVTKTLAINFDTERDVTKTLAINFDVERQISNSNVLVADFDFERILTRAENFFVDVERKLLNAINFSADMERNLTRTVNLNVDVKQTVAKTQYLSFDVERVVPIIVPFIGEHFNHIIGSLSLTRGENKKIILPKKSSVYIRATGDGAIRIFSDTDREGKKTGEFYAQLDECNTVFIVPTDSPLRVIRDFVHALSETTLSGTEALDEAINYCTRGIFDTRSAVVEKFMNDLSGFDASGDKTFLQDYCDINVANADTGAITGIDAGGGGEKTAQSIVPEPVPVEDWVVPVSGSSKTIHGLTINFPTSGASGALTDVEKHILAGLNSVWFDQCLKLVEKSFGLSFRDEDSTVKTINVEFENDSTNSALAYTAYTFDTTSGKTVALRLVINMWHYNSIDTGSADGAATYTLYLDRTLAHELTHAVMAANIDNFNSLPTFIKEGIAELVHGIDNTRRSDITALVTSRRSDLQTIISGIKTDATNSYFYSAGYLFLRYLAKQGQNDSFAPQTLEITNLLISDGATDSDYEALTDNTRQIFAADILRALSCSFEGEFDIVILSVLTVKVLTDVLRNIIAQVNLFARQKEEPFNPDIPTPEPIDLPVNTKGIRDFEVSIAEQQISDQVRFTAVTPYDVQQEISGQYLDYKYNMVIERVQQQGILHSCECFSNINDLLYTQLNYKIPPITSWYKINGEQVGGTQQTVEIKTVYPLASTHATSIAKALKLKAQIQFDDFLSTVLMDEKGGVTYNDLIRDIFGWSSRVPTMLINVFPRDGKLFFIQRGHETHSVDITQSKHTVPVITREIVRTSYGSSVESTTTINEYDITANTFTPDTIVGGEEGGGEEEKWVTLQDKSSGENWTATTTYYYSKGNDMSPAGGKIPAGLLVKVETEKSYSYGSEEADSFTQIMHTYDSDGTRIGTETYVHYTGGTNPTTDTRNINLLRYITLPNGEKYLASESTERYEEGETGYPDKLVDSTITNHSPTRLGQTHVTTITDDGIAGGVTGQNTGDDRITPYSQRKAQATATALANANGTWEETTTHYESGMTVYGLALFDSSFPIHDEATLIKVTNAIKALNGKIKETVSLTVYDLEHLIDFDDTITFNGNSYFLVSNTARTTPRILLEQNLTLVRWT